MAGAEEIDSASAFQEQLDPASGARQAGGHFISASVRFDHPLNGFSCLRAGECRAYPRS
jgi:hypothetical protein